MHHSDVRGQSGYHAGTARSTGYEDLMGLVNSQLGQVPPPTGLEEVFPKGKGRPGVQFAEQPKRRR